MFDDSMRVGDYYAHALPTDPSPSNQALVTNDFIGVEIELERIGHFRELMFNSISNSMLWDYKEDGSLRDGGGEIVFRGPLNGDRAVAAIEAYRTTLADLRPTRRPLASVRSSVHVHVDVRDLRRSELLRMLVLYSIFETILFKTYAKSRMASHFCLPFQGCVDMFGAAANLHQSFARFNRYIDHSDRGRYCAFNIKAIQRFGTLEFRHLGGTLDADLILEWINACLSFKQAARRDIDFSSEFFNASRHGFEHTIEQYFPMATARRVMAHYADNEPEHQLFRDMVNSIQFAQAMSQPITFV